MNISHFYKIILFVACLLSMTSCIEQVEIPIRNEQVKLVVEGSITSLKPPYTIKLSYSGAFEYTTKIPQNSIIKYANVSATDDLGKEIVFYPQGDGTYLTLSGEQYRGKSGRTYTLKITLPSGQVYQSNPEKMPDAVPVSNVYYEYQKVPLVIPANRIILNPNGYNIFVDFQDPANVKNYYRWFAKTTSLRSTTGITCSFFSKCDVSCHVELLTTNNLNIFSDTYSNGTLVKKRQMIFSPLFAPGYHYVEIYQYSLSQPAYQFWKNFEEQQTRTGSIFDPLPASIQGNIYNVKDPTEIVLGYFEASGVQRKKYILDNTNDPDLGLKLPLNDPFIGRINAEGPCTVAFPGAYPTGQFPPAGWLQDVN